MQLSYMKDPTPLWREAVRSLRVLMQNEDLDDARRAFAEATHEEYKRKYAALHGLRRTTGRRCIQRLLGGRCQAPGECECHPPGDDHANLWLCQGEPFSYTFEPYGLGSDTLAKLVDFCQRHALEPRMSADSWHFPGRCILVEIRTPENWRKTPGCGAGGPANSSPTTESSC